MVEDDYLVDELKEKLAKSGFLENAKIRLRSEILLALRGEIDLSSNRKYSLKEQAIQHLILDYLRLNDLHYTLPIYQSEAGLKNEFTIEEIFDLFGIPKQFLCDMNHSYRQHLSVIYRLISIIGRTCNYHGQKKHLKEVSTQTSWHQNDTISTTKMLNSGITDSWASVSGNSLESHLFKFQRECEVREKKLMEEKLELYKRDLLSRVQFEESKKKNDEMDRLKADMKRDYDRAMTELQKKYADEKMNLETQFIQEKRSLVQEIAGHKQREIDDRNNLEIERRKLKLEEQKCKHAFKTAEAKLKYIESKELELKERAGLEYQNCRDEAKRSYEEALEMIQKQGKIYKDGIDELNSLRKLNSEQLMMNEKASIEISELRVQKKSLELELNQLRTSLERFQKELKRAQISNTSIKSKLDKALNEVSKHKAKQNDYKKHHQDFQIEYQNKVKETLSVLERTKVEKMTIENDNLELRQLLDTMQRALLSFPTQTLYCNGSLRKSQRSDMSEVFDNNTERRDASSSVQKFQDTSSSSHPILKECAEDSMTSKQHKIDLKAYEKEETIRNNEDSNFPLGNTIIMNGTCSTEACMSMIESKDVYRCTSEKNSDTIDLSSLNKAILMSTVETESNKEAESIFSIIERETEVRLSPISTDYAEVKRDLPTKENEYADEEPYHSSDFDSESFSSSFS